MPIIILLSMELSMADTNSATHHQRSFLVDRGFVSIELQGEDIFIDYGNGLLHRFTHFSGLCATFSLKDQLSDSDFTRELVIPFGEMRLVEKSGDIGKKKELNKTVIFGAKFLLSKPAITPTIEVYGLKFKPRAVQFAVAKDHPDFKEIQRISDYNVDEYVVNPLLSQIDVTRLVSFLDGLVVGKQEKKEKESFTYNLVEKEQQRKRLKRLCGEL